jgi:hypothetical protein
MPVDCEPLNALLPDHPPEAEQDVAFVAIHFSVELVPFAMVLGVAAMLTVGAGDFTDTVTDWVAVPRTPVQVNVYVALAVSAPEGCDPARILPPDQAPDAEQAVALSVDQLITDVPPASTLLGLAPSAITGANAETVTVADWEAEPPVPVQVSS